MGIRHVFVNQPVEVTELRPRFAETFGRADIELQPLAAINAVFDSLGRGEVPSRVVIDFGGA